MSILSPAQKAALLLLPITTNVHVDDGEGFPSQDVRVSTLHALERRGLVQSEDGESRYSWHGSSFVRTYTSKA